MDSDNEIVWVPQVLTDSEISVDNVDKFFDCIDNVDNNVNFDNSSTFLDFNKTFNFSNSFSNSNVNKYSNEALDADQEDNAKSPHSCITDDLIFRTKEDEERYLKEYLEREVPREEIPKNPSFVDELTRLLFNSAEFVTKVFRLDFEDFSDFLAHLRYLIESNITHILCAIGALGWLIVSIFFGIWYVIQYYLFRKPKWHVSDVTYVNGTAPKPVMIS